MGQDSSNLVLKPVNIRPANNTIGKTFPIVPLGTRGGLSNW